MKENNKGLIWLIMILIVLVIGLGGFIVFDKIILEEAKTSLNAQNNTDEESILRRDKFTINLNSKERNVSYVYKYMTSEEYYKNEDFDLEAEKLAKENNEYIYNMVYLEILLDEKKIEALNIPIYYDMENVSYDNLKYKIEKLSSDTINIVKGIDKDYLVFAIEDTHPIVDGQLNPIIVNENGELIYKLNLGTKSSLKTIDVNSKFYEKNSMFIIEEDKIYYLTFVEYKEDKLYVQENYLTINNDKIETYKGNVYEGTGTGQY